MSCDPLHDEGALPAWPGLEIDEGTTTDSQGGGVKGPMGLEEFAGGSDTVKPPVVKGPLGVPEGPTPGAGPNGAAFVGGTGTDTQDPPKGPMGLSDEGEE